MRSSPSLPAGCESSQTCGHAWSVPSWRQGTEDLVGAFPRSQGVVVTWSVPFWGQGKLAERVLMTYRSKTIHNEHGREDVPFSLGALPAAPPSVHVARWGSPRWLGQNWR